MISRNSAGVTAYSLLFITDLADYPVNFIKTQILQTAFCDICSHLSKSTDSLSSDFFVRVYPDIKRNPAFTHDSFHDIKNVTS